MDIEISATNKESSVCGSWNRYFNAVSYNRNKKEILKSGFLHGDAVLYKSRKGFGIRPHTYSDLSVYKVKSHNGTKNSEYIVDLTTRVGIPVEKTEWTVGYWLVKSNGRWIIPQLWVSFYTQTEAVEFLWEKLNSFQRLSGVGFNYVYNELYITKQLANKGI